MQMKTIGIALFGLVLVAALALPASAASANGNAFGKAGKIDSGLKSDLWAVHARYRLQVFDTHVEGANAAVTVLGNHGCPTADLAATVSSIGGERSALADALTNKDRTALKTVNEDLANLWKQFARQAKASVKACSGQTGTGTTVGNPTAAEL